MRIPQFRPLFIFFLSALSVALLAACGGGDRDETAPALTISSPIKSPTIDPNVTLSGDVEAGALVEITQTTATTGSRTIVLDDPSAPAAGTWSASFSLDPGSNLVNVTAIDDAENSKSISVTIILADAVLTPLNGATEVPLDTVIAAEFRNPINTPPNESFLLFLNSDLENPLQVSLSFDPGTPNRAALAPVSGLAPGTTYRTVISPATAKITDETGAEIAEGAAVFTTAAQ